MLQTYAAVVDGCSQDLDPHAPVIRRHRVDELLINPASSAGFKPCHDMTRRATFLPALFGVSMPAARSVHALVYATNFRTENTQAHAPCGKNVVDPSHFVTQNNKKNFISACICVCVCECVPVCMRGHVNSKHAQDLTCHVPFGCTSLAMIRYRRRKTFPLTKCV